MKMEARFDVLLETDMFIMIVDRDDGGRSVTNDVCNVVQRLSSLLGGIGKRRVYYRDSQGRFDEIKVSDESFSGFGACSENQQIMLEGWMQEDASSAAPRY
jgi:hypothetical protein